MGKCHVESCRLHARILQTDFLRHHRLSFRASLMESGKSMMAMRYFLAMKGWLHDSMSDTSSATFIRQSSPTGKHFSDQCETSAGATWRVPAVVCSWTQTYGFLFSMTSCWHWNVFKAGYANPVGMWIAIAVILTQEVHSFFKSSFDEWFPQWLCCHLNYL